MFDSVSDFKKSFTHALLMRYGETVEESHISEQFDVLGSMVRDYAAGSWRETRQQVNAGKKTVCYFSMEFLMGRLLTNNMQNLGIYDLVKKGLEDLGIDINMLEDQESDAGLGNGGLGRLAACFLDSISTLGYSCVGNCIRYEYGFFRQLLEKGRQFEVPDQWLTNGFVFEARKPKHSVEVEFGGNVESYLKSNGEFALRTVNAVHVKAVPYDVSIIGYNNKIVNTLRLWAAEPSEENLPKGVPFQEYLTSLREITSNLYPDDSTDQGRRLRLRQQYFMVSAGLQSILRGHLRLRGTFDTLPDYYVIQLNDTHPIMAIPELMRLLMDVYGYGWDKAWEIVNKCVAYTNHTILQEALERWPVQFMRDVCPRCFSIIEEISRRFDKLLADKNVDTAKRDQMRIIRDGQVQMAPLAIVASFSVNGVAKLHTDILKNDTFKYFYELFPEKFNNKTNGVTQRRWLMYSNPKLAKAITKRIGSSWTTNMETDLIKLKKYCDDPAFLKEIMDIKQENKFALAKIIKERNGIDVDPYSIFDVQVKRLHAYKRQLMNIFHVIYLYQRIKADPSFTPVPRTFIFGAKAAPSYVYAKKIIQLILSVADVVNHDPDVSQYVKVVFIENYGVTLAEKIIPAADVSEQISTASKEASGTSNMKFMMNGAITLGTMDGANIEIHDLVGDDNIVTFGLSSQEVLNYYANGGYNAWEQYRDNQVVHDVMDSLFHGPWATKQDKFQLIVDEIMNNNDYFFILKDLPAYIEAQEKVADLYSNKQRWAKMCAVNIAMSGFFSSDRTIREYIKDIWKLDQLKENK